MKSAYELALERMESQGIERPGAGALTDAERDTMAEIRRRAEARLAELSILHQQKLASARSLGERETAEEEYRIDRRRVEDDRDAKIARIREGA